MRVSSVRCLLAVPIALSVALPARAEDNQPTIKTFAFDHFLQKAGGTSITQLTDGEPFKVVLYHTCPQDFDYSIYKSPAIQQAQGARDFAPPPPQPGAPVPPRNPSQTITKGPITHESKWGSYILQVSRKTAAAETCSVWVDATNTPVEPPAEALKDVKYTGAKGEHWLSDVAFDSANYIVSVQTSEWEIGADAALVFTAGVDRQYTAVASPADATHKIVAQDTDGQASGRVSFGTLTHLYLPNARIPTGPVLGFSVLSAQNNQTEYYFGWGAGIGPRKGRLNLAVGTAFSPVPTLPAGIHVGDTISDASAIATLRSVYHWKFFFALTATAFRTGDDSSNKPPAPDPGKSQK